MKKFFMFFIAVALVAAFSVPAVAADAEWSFYGSARMATFYVDTSKEAAGVHTPADDDQDTQWTQQGNSRIGANVKAGDVGGRFEYGTGVNVRLLYGTWNFGAGTLTVGRAYTPMTVINSNQVYASDNDLVGYGYLFSRLPMIQVQFGSLKIALVEPSTTGAAGFITGTPATVANIGGVATPVAAVPAAIPGGEVDTTLPKIEVQYGFKTDMLDVGIVGGYNSYEIEGDAKTYDVDSWVVSLWGNVNLGPAYIKANIYKAQNEAAYGLGNGGNSSFDFVGNKIKDMDTLGYVVCAGVKLSDAFAIEGGYGAVSNESDVTGEKDDDASAMYVQATIGLAPGVTITPEIGKIDNEKNHADAKEGDIVYFGAKWQINF